MGDTLYTHAVGLVNIAAISRWKQIKQASLLQADYLDNYSLYNMQYIMLVLVFWTMMTQGKQKVKVDILWSVMEQCYSSEHLPTQIQLT